MFDSILWSNRLHAQLFFQEPLLLLLLQQLQQQPLPQQQPQLPLPPLPQPQKPLLLPLQQQRQKHLIVEVKSMVLLDLYSHLTGQINTHPMLTASGP